MSVPDGPGALDASTARTRGREAASHDPRAVGSGVVAHLQDEAGRRRSVDGDHAGGGEPLQHAEPRRGPRDAPPLPGDQTVRTWALRANRPRDEAGDLFVPDPKSTRLKSRHRYISY